MYLCTKCGKNKSKNDFLPDRRSCRACGIVRAKEWASKNHEQVKETKRLYYLKNRDRIKARTALYRKNNPEKDNKWKKDWADKNRDLVREKTLTRFRKVYKTERGRITYLAKTHWGRVKDFNPSASKTIFTYDQWNELLEKNNNACVMCKRSFTSGLKPTIDHIVAIKDGGTNDISNIQPLCQSCNCKKHVMKQSSVSKQENSLHNYI